MQAEGHGKRILVVDDEHTIREVVRRYLEHAGFTVDEAMDGQGALDAVAAQVPDLIVLDLMLPGIDGLQVMRRLKQVAPARQTDIPIVMLTARGETSDRILGLDLGADDYLAKPFSPQELVARVRAVLRRTGDVASEPSTPSGPPLDYSGLRIDPTPRLVTVQGLPVALTAREFDLLWFLASHPMQVFTRDQLLDKVWGYDFYGDASTVTVHIRRLREKLERDPSNPRYIMTVWGVGYRFEGEI